MDYKEECRKKLSDMTNKKHIAFTKRGNQSIKIILTYLKDNGVKRVLIQDQGGWLTYPQFIDKLGLEKVEIKTDDGIVDPDTIKQTDDSALLINSMPGYASLQPMDRLTGMLVNDVSGSIGMEQAKSGNIVFGSFGKDKPVNHGAGGFIGSGEELFEDQENDIDFEKLYGELNNLSNRLEKLGEVVQKIKTDLKDFDVFHRDSFECYCWLQVRG